MKNFNRYFFLLFVFMIPILVNCVEIGIGKTDITPPIGTPSAGYRDRKGTGMENIHDPLFAIALFINNGDKKIVFCSVDHLGFTHDMIQEIIEKVHTDPKLAECNIYIGSSHTHSGGGAFLNFPVLGESLAGKYNPQIRNFYIQKTAQAIIEACKSPIKGRIGIGHGHAEGLNLYRGQWPKDIIPQSELTIIKITKEDGSPFAVLFNYPMHPTILKENNKQFSSDFVGYAREYIQILLGNQIQPIYFNGAQGDIIPNIYETNDNFDSCKRVGKSLAEKVKKIWDETKTYKKIKIATQKKSYSFKPLPTPFGLVFPVEKYKSEMNIIVLNNLHAFITVPGELSCLYHKSLKEFGEKIGFTNISIFGLINDAHGYIILPESWRHKTNESNLSFGGENYGDLIEKLAKDLLEKNAPLISN